MATSIQRRTMRKVSAKRVVATVMLFTISVTLIQIYMFHSTMMDKESELALKTAADLPTFESGVNHQSGKLRIEVNNVPHANNEPPLTPGGIQRREILKACGELCNLNRPILKPDPDFGYFGYSTSRTNCTALFESSILDDPGNFTSPPRWSDVPHEFVDDYKMGGRAKVEEWWIKDMFLGGKAKVSNWDKDMIESWKAMALENDFTKFGNYQLIDRSTLLNVLTNVSKVQDQSVLVIGSESPWIEALVLAAGARRVTTLEYGAIQTNHPRVTTYTPNEFRTAYLEGDLEQFDAVVSYSSLEHSGLGRYGDALNPWGDIMAVARAWCVTKPKGTLTLGLSSMSKDDLVYFNAGRVYGPNRWPYVVTNWLRMNYSSGWTDDVIKNAPQIPRRLRGPPGFNIFWNQSSLVFRRSGPSGSADELKETNLLQTLL